MTRPRGATARANTDSHLADVRAHVEYNMTVGQEATRDLDHGVVEHHSLRYRVNNQINSGVGWDGEPTGGDFVEERPRVRVSAC